MRRYQVFTGPWHSEIVWFCDDVLSTSPPYPRWEVLIWPLGVPCYPSPTPFSSFVDLHFWFKHQDLLNNPPACKSSSDQGSVYRNTNNYEETDYMSERMRLCHLIYHVLPDIHAAYMTYIQTIPVADREKLPTSVKDMATKDSSSLDICFKHLLLLMW